MFDSRMRPPGRIHSFFAVLCAALLWTASAGDVLAQGFGVYEQGTCVMSRAGAAAASGCDDGSSLFFNPANIAGTDGITVSAGATLIAPGGEFTYDALSEAPNDSKQVELQNDPIPAPHLFATYGINEKMAAGLGVYVPYGLETIWPRRVDGQVFDGAFEGYNNSVQSIYIQPTFSYQVTPRLAIGGGPIVSVSRVELNQFQDLSQQTVVNPQTGDPIENPVTGNPLRFSELGVPFHTAFADASLEGSGALGFGANLGVSFQATDRLRFGARFMTPITTTFDDGEATFEQVNTNLVLPPGNPISAQLGQPQTPIPLDDVLAGQFQGDGSLTTQGVETELTFPMQLVGGVSFQATPKLLVMADYQFTGWSSFDEIPLQFEKLGDRSREEGYESTHAVRLGAEYDLTEQWTGRLGYLYNTSAAPDEVVTPLLPEAERNQFTIGVGWQPTDVLEVNVSYQLLMQNDRRGRVRGALPGEEVSTDLNQGLYSFGANLFGTTITLHL